MFFFSNRNSLTLVFLTALISGFSIFFNKFGVTGLDSSVYTFAKNVVVSLLLLCSIYLLGNFGKLKVLTGRQWAWLAAVGLVGGSIPFLLFFRGLQLTSSAGASFIQKTMFVFVGVLAFFFLKEKFSKRVFLAAVLLLAGNWLLLGLTGFKWDYGSTLVLAATVLWAVENTISKRLLKELDGSSLAFGRMFFGAVFILLFISFTGEVALLPGFSLEAWGWVAATSVMLFAYVVTWYNGLKHVDVTLATAVLLLGSPITTLLNVFFAGAVLTPVQVLGMVLLAGGIALMLLFSDSLSIRPSGATH